MPGSPCCSSPASLVRVWGNRPAEGREGHRGEPGHRHLHGVDPRSPPRGQDAGGPALRIGRGPGHGEGALTGGDRESDGCTGQGPTGLVEQSDDERLAQGGAARPLLGIPADLAQRRGDGLGEGGEDHRLQIAHGDLHGVRSGSQAQSQRRRRLALGIGRGRLYRNRPAAAGDREGDLCASEGIAVLIPHHHDKGLVQGGIGVSLLLIAGQPRQSLRMGQNAPKVPDQNRTVVRTGGEGRSVSRKGYGLHFPTMALGGGEQGARGNVPHLDHHGTVRIGPRQDERTIGGKGRGIDPGRRVLHDQGGRIGSRRHFPYRGHARGPSESEGRPIRCKGHGVDLIGQTVPTQSIVAAGQIPQSDPAIYPGRIDFSQVGLQRRGGAGQGRSIGRKGEGAYVRAMAHEGSDLVPRGHVPDRRRVVTMPRGDLASVR